MFTEQKDSLFTPRPRPERTRPISPYFYGVLPEKPITIGELELLTQEEKENLPVIYFINGEEVCKSTFDRYSRLKIFW